MKKIFTLIAMAAMAMGMQAQDKVMLYWPDDAEQGNKVELQDGAVVQITGNESKNIQNGKKITVDGVEYMTMKVSNGAQNTLTLTKPAKKITFYSYINKAYEDGLRTSYWKEVDGKDYDESGVMSCFSDDLTQPDVRSYDLNGITSITFTNTGEQLCYIMEIEYGEGSGDNQQGGEVTFTEIWKAAEFDLSNATMSTLTEGIYGAGTVDAPDTSVPGTLETSTIVVSTDNVTMTGVSTPNSLSHKDVDEGKTQTYWDLKGSAVTEENPTPNDALITDVCDPQFAQYLMPKGNPGFQHWEYYETNSDGDEVFRVGDIFWEPGNDMPAKGAYYKFEIKGDGVLKVAIYGNKNTNPTYIVDAATKQPLAPSTVNVAIYYQNNTFVYDEQKDEEGNVIEGTQKYFNEGVMADDYVLQHTNGITQNRPVLGYVSFNVEAGKTYYIFNPKSQVGIYGFAFGTGSGTGIREIVTVKNDPNAPVYNLAGQRVSPNTKGILIKNGKKYINK